MLSRCARLYASYSVETSLGKALIFSHLSCSSTYFHDSYQSSEAWQKSSSDLVAPFLVVFLSEYLEGGIDNWSMSDLSSDEVSNVEADCYWCLSKLLDGMQDHYTFAQPGIQRLVFKLKELVRRIDGNFFLRRVVFLQVYL